MTVADQSVAAKGDASEERATDADNRGRQIPPTTKTALGVVHERRMTTDVAARFLRAGAELHCPAQTSLGRGDATW